MADLVASTTGPKVKVSVALANDLPAAHADLNQLEMALLNLAVNARDAMPNGGRLRITAEGEEIGTGHRSGLQPGPYVRLGGRLHSSCWRAGSGRSRHHRPPHVWHDGR
jgi:signal transduction histidine kinase